MLLSPRELLCAPHGASQALLLADGGNKHIYPPNPSNRTQSHVRSGGERPLLSPGGSFQSQAPHLEELERGLLDLLLQLRDELVEERDLLGEVGDVLVLPLGDVLLHLLQLPQQEMLLVLQEAPQPLELREQLLPLARDGFLGGKRSERRGGSGWRRDLGGHGAPTNLIARGASGCVKGQRPWKGMGMESKGRKEPWQRHPRREEAPTRAWGGRS